MVEGDVRVAAPGQATVDLRLLRNGLPVAGVLPPRRGCLARGGDHPRHENEHLNGNPIGHQRCGEATVRLTDDDQITPIINRVDDGIGVVEQAGRVVVTGQVGCDRLMAEAVQLSLHEVPVPTHVAATVDERERRHRSPPSAGHGVASSR